MTWRGSRPRSTPRSRPTRRRADGIDPYLSRQKYGPKRKRPTPPRNCAGSASRWNRCSRIRSATPRPTPTPSLRPRPTNHHYRECDPWPTTSPTTDTAEHGAQNAPWADTAERAAAAELEPAAELEQDATWNMPENIPADDGDQGDDDPDTFTREYVTDLRRESAAHRTRANTADERADTLARQLWAERVGALGLLADPADLPYDADALDDPDEIVSRLTSF